MPVPGMRERDPILYAQSHDYHGPLNLRNNGRFMIESRIAYLVPWMIARMRLANTSIAKGLVIISMPGSRKPFASVAFSA